MNELPMSRHDSDAGSADRSEEFVRLLKKHERRLNGYVLSLVHNWTDADDIVQDVAVRLWQQFDDFKPDADFGAWACKIAYYQVLTHRKRAGRERLRFSAEFARAVADEIAAVSTQAGEDQETLLQCLEKLAPPERELLRDYYSGTSIALLAEQMGRTAAALYKNLSNLRRSLRACIERTSRDQERHP
jgi:RNA polymerase sigma-70 factor (ECF subfamily)